MHLFRWGHIWFLLGVVLALATIGLLAIGACISIYNRFLLSKLDQILSVLLCLFFESQDGSIHVNGEGDNDVEPDDDAKVVEDDEKVAPNRGSSHDVDTHGNDHIPIIDDNEDEEGDVGR